VAYYGLLIEVTHTGKAGISVFLSDIDDAVSDLDSFRKPGPIYVPINGTVKIVYTQNAATSFEVGAIRQFVNNGYLTARFCIGQTLADAIFPEIQDEGVQVDPSAQIINFTGAGVTATQVVAGEVKVDIPGGGAGGDHAALINLGWLVSGHTGAVGSLGAFDNAGNSALITGGVQGEILYFDGNDWTRLAPGVAGQVLQTNGVGANPSWAAPAAAGSPQLLWGDNSVGSSTTTRYLTPGYDDGLAETGPTQIRVARAGTLRNLRVRHNVPKGNGNNIVYTIRVNNIAAGVTVTLASTATDGSDLVNSVVVAAGDLVDIEVTKAAGVGTSPNNITATVEYV